LITISDPWVPNQSRIYDVTCPSGKRVFGGGVALVSGIRAIASYPRTDTTWRAALESDVTTDGAVMFVYAVCGNAS